ncbi:sulfatase-like hydrolase/transferase [Candidatus Sumerlaeota bacterium]|nr:sulfatase-like hydrolase/transferase [Candidatus Sumerlaeota bacterium]
MNPYNILWVCADQQRFDTLNCYGNPFVHTPNLNGLAERGTIFNNCFSQSPVCTPSRSCFLTGRYPRTTGCRQNGQDIPETEIPVTKILSDAGYTCGLSGKLHLSACHPDACPTIERRIDDGYSEFYWSHHPYRDEWPGYNQYQLWLKEKGEVCDPPQHPECKWVAFSPREEFHHTTWCANKGIDFIERRANDKSPWLFSMNLFDPHHPFDAPEEYLSRYMPFLDEIPLPNYVEGELEHKTVFQRIDHEGAYGRERMYPFTKMSEKDHRLIRASYYAMCDLIDAQAGRLIKALEETGQSENTIVIFSADHGEMLGDHGIYLKGPYFYEPAIHVPLIISFPGHIKQGRSEALIELADIAPTLLEAVGLPRHPGMQGRSFWKLLSGEEERNSRREDVYCEYYNALDSHRDPTAQLTMARTPHIKIVVDHSHSFGELYDLKKDPKETNNLWDDPDYRDVKMEMLLRVCNRMAWTVDPLPLRRSGW